MFFELLDHVLRSRRQRRRLLMELLRASGLSPSALDVLKVLSTSKTPLSHAEIAEQAAMSKGTASESTARLARAKLVARAPSNARHRRATRVAITDLGRRKLAAILRKHPELVEPKEPCEVITVDFTAPRPDRTLN
jgi:DNA-binding MarR family transcriptional regulator